MLKALFTDKIVLGLGAFLALIGVFAAAPHTWIYFHEEKCPEELLKEE